jgi:hypothetical protein
MNRGEILPDAWDALDAFREDLARLLRAEAQHGVFVACTCCEPGRYGAWPTPLHFRGEAIWVMDIVETSWRDPGPPELP